MKWEWLLIKSDPIACQISNHAWMYVVLINMQDRYQEDQSDKIREWVCNS